VTAVSAERSTAVAAPKEVLSREQRAVDVVGDELFVRLDD